MILATLLVGSCAKDEVVVDTPTDEPDSVTAAKSRLKTNMRTIRQATVARRKNRVTSFGKKPLPHKAGRPRMCSWNYSIQRTGPWRIFRGSWTFHSPSISPTATGSISSKAHGIPVTVWDRRPDKRGPGAVMRCIRSQNTCILAKKTWETGVMTCIPRLHPCCSPAKTCNPRANACSARQTTLLFLATTRRRRLKTCNLALFTCCRRQMTCK